MEKLIISRVAELRKLQGKTQRQVALEIGCTEATLRNWETGRSGLDWFEKITKLCKALNCQPEDLIEYREPEV